MAQALRAPVGEADFLNDQLLDLNTPLAQTILTAATHDFKPTAAAADPVPDDAEPLGLGSSLPLSLHATLVAPHEIALDPVRSDASSYSRIDAEGPTRTAPGSATGVTAPAALGPAAPGPAGSLTTLAT
ncbi:MAG: hypothetical protein ABIR04_07420, partial [Cypionkella sp.]